MAENASKGNGDNVLSYASPQTRGKPVAWGKVVIGTMLFLLLAGAVMLPALPRSHGPAYRAQCATNEQQILYAIYDYAKKNGGNTPASLQQLRASVGTQSISSQKIFHCPLGAEDYVYLGQGLTLNTAPKDMILIYEPPTNHKNTQTGKGAMNVVHIDGSVHLIEQPQADKIIAELKAGHNPPREEMIK